MADELKTIQIGDLPVAETVEDDANFFLEQNGEAYRLSGENLFKYSKGNKGDPGERGLPGTDGISPEVTTEEVEGGTKVTIVDAKGEHEFTVYNGKDGKDGSGGEGSGGTFPVKAPVGTIVIWSGTTEDIPDGWHLCDGEDGTPDLRDKFILGAGGENHSAGESGGSETVTLTVSNMPKHSHTTAIGTGSGSTTGDHIGANIASGIYPGTSISTYTAGSGVAHDNMPPYYALCYIMKIKPDETDAVGIPPGGHTTVLLRQFMWDGENNQTVTCMDVVQDDDTQLIITVPKKSDKDAYFAAGIEPVDQLDNAIVFHAEKVPDHDISVNVYINLFSDNIQN